MHESANTENRISLQVLDPVLQLITGSLRKPRRQRQRGKLPNKRFKEQAPVVQRLDNAIHRINHYPAYSLVCFVNTYRLDSDLSGG